jgi:DNA-binding response OmpR family regulator
VDEMVKVLGQKLGVNDFMTKLFYPHELLASIRTRLRYSQPPQAAR